MEKSMQYEAAIKQVEEEKSFYNHVITYVLVIGALWIFNALTGHRYWWAIWPTFGWGIGLLSHGNKVFGKNIIFGSRWEKRRLKQLMERDLGV